MSDSYSTDANLDQQPDDALWDQIAEKVDELVEAWQVADGDEPRLEDLIDDLPARQRRTMLYELIKTDLECRWQGRRAPQPLEFYLSQFPELGGRDGLPEDLIYEEVQVRLHAGDAFDMGEIARRFPKQAAGLGSLLGTIALPGTPSQRIDGLEQTQDFVSPPESESKSTAIEAANLDELKEGDSIDDFDLLLMLGRGSFARVFLARQRSLERLVALKVSKSEGSEPRTLAQLDHPNIVRVFDQRSCRSPSVRLLYMELVPGGTLKDVIDAVAESPRERLTGQLLLEVVDERLASSGIAPPEGSEIRQVMRQSTWSMAVCRLGHRLAEGLSYAHEKGVLHRDIKPANVLLTPEGSPKLADFNVSFQGGRADEDPTDAFGGSLAYMSPEQLEACHPLLGGSPMRVREPSDVYSLGIVLFELVAGHRPFKDASPDPAGWAASLQRMLDQRRAVDLDALQQSLPGDCPSSLKSVLSKCLQPSGKQRYRTARQLADALRLCLHPRCWRLMQSPRGWSKLPLTHPVLTVLAVTLLPSVFAAAFNFYFNHERLLKTLASAQDVFMRVQAFINGTAFPIGIAICVFAAHRCARRLRAPASPQPTGGGATAMFLGQFMARLALTLWVISGLAYPVAIHYGLPDGVTVGVYVHFALSLTLYGVLSGTYPFFLVTLIGMRWFIPEMIRREIIRGPRRADLQKVRRLNRFYLILTALVPLMGVLLIVLAARSAADDRHHLIFVSATGLAGFGLMFWLHREIDEDVLALQDLAAED